MQKRTWIMPSLSKSRTSVFAFWIGCCGRDRKIMHDDGQSVEFMLIFQVSVPPRPHTMIQLVHEPCCQTLFSHRCSCRLCRTLQDVVRYLCRGKHEACGMATSVRPLFAWVSHTHSKHGRCGNGFVCVNVFESGVYFCAGCRSGDRIQEINRRRRSFV
jgi:hypothetical protein